VHGNGPCNVTVLLRSGVAVHLTSSIRRAHNITRANGFLFHRSVFTVVTTCNAEQGRAVCIPCLPSSIFSSLLTTAVRPLQRQ
jgi:hypothetical protein